MAQNKDTGIDSHNTGSLTEKGNNILNFKCKHF